MARPRPHTWIEREDGLVGAWRELGRLKRRAAARPLATLGATLLLCGLMVAREARKVPSYESRVVFRLDEGDVDLATASKPGRKLKSYIETVVFSNERLVDLMKRHKLGGARLKTAPNEAAESFREDIGVEVWRNYFIEYRGYGDAARSAHFSIEYAHSDPQVALSVVQDLAAMVTAEAAATNVERAEREVAQLDTSIAAEHDELSRLQAQITRNQLLLARATPVEREQLRLEEQRMRGSIEDSEKRLHTFEAQRTDYRLRAALERNQLGLRFEVVEAPQQAKIRVGRPKKLAMFGLVMFVMLLPFVGMAVGAWDNRVRDADDLRRLGLEPLGHLPRFPGDDVGSLEARMKRKDRA